MLGRRVSFSFFVLASLCFGRISLAEDVPSTVDVAGMTSLMVASTTGTPPVDVRQWFRLISMAPNPPGGPKLYFMTESVRPPRFDGYTHDINVAPTEYAVLLKASQSFGCDPKLRNPDNDTKAADIPAVELSVHGGGLTRRLCRVSYGKICVYLNSLENFKGAHWTENTREALGELRLASHC